MNLKAFELESKIVQAQARAEPIARQLIGSDGGPELASLVLYVARAEVLRVAELRMPAGAWKVFLARQRELERAFDVKCEAIRATNSNVLELRGPRRG